jgi:hypothetical protein
MHGSVTRRFAIAVPFGLLPVLLGRQVVHRERVHLAAIPRDQLDPPPILRDGGDRVVARAGPNQERGAGWLQRYMAALPQ